jgi:hypothetical protein
VALEEEGVEDGWIPEWARARLLGVDFHDDRVRAVKITCVRGVGEDAAVKVKQWSCRLGDTRFKHIYEYMVSFESDLGMYIQV